MVRVKPSILNRILSSTVGTAFCHKDTTYFILFMTSYIQSDNQQHVGFNSCYAWEQVIHKFSFVKRFTATSTETVKIRNDLYIIKFRKLQVPEHVMRI